MTTEEKIKQLTERFEKQMAALSNQIAKKADEIEEDSDILADKGIGFTITDENGNKYNFEWKEVSLHIPVPHFSIREQNFAFDVPSIAMKTNSIIFNVPAVKMVDKQIGIKPETKCGWETRTTLGVKHKYWACKVYDTPIIITVPEPYMKEINIKVDIPEIKMVTQQIIMNLPSVTIEMKYVKFHSIVLTGIDYDTSQDNIEDAETEINNGQKKIELLTASFENELNSLTIQLTQEKFDEAEEELKARMRPHQKKYEDGITELKSSIKVLKNNNAVEKVKEEESNLARLINEMETFLKPYEDALVELNKSREEALKQLKTVANNL